MCHEILYGRLFDKDKLVKISENVIWAKSNQEISFRWITSLLVPEMMKNKGGEVMVASHVAGSIK